MSTGATEGGLPAQDEEATIASSRSGSPSASVPARVQTKKRTGETCLTSVLKRAMPTKRTAGSSPTCGDTKRYRPNDPTASSPCHATPGNTSTPCDDTRTPCAQEAFGVELQSPCEFTKSGEADRAVPVLRTQVQMPPTAISGGFTPQATAVEKTLPPEASKQSNAQPGRQLAMSAMARCEDIKACRHHTSSTKKGLHGQDSAKKVVRHAVGRTTGPQLAKNTQTLGKTPTMTTGSVRNEGKQLGELRSSSGGDLEAQIVKICETGPPTPDSSGEPHLEFQTALPQPSHNQSREPQPSASGITKSGHSDVRISRPSQSPQMGYYSPEAHAEPQQRGRSASTTRAVDGPAKSSVSETGAHVGLDMSDIDTCALGEQVKLARTVRAKREELTKDMKELESKRREAYLKSRSSQASMDADIKEHVELSEALERLQSVVKRKKREAAAVVRRIDVGRGTANRIRMEQQACEDSIKRMEGEFSSSGKQLQGILQALGILY